MPFGGQPHRDDLKMRRNPVAGTVVAPDVTYSEADLKILWQRAFLRCRAVGAATEDARDCAQDAIVELIARPDVKLPKAWVATVAYHRYVDLSRQQARERCVGLVPMPVTGAADQPGPEELVVSRVHASWLVKMMKRLPVSTRMVCYAVGKRVSRLDIIKELSLTDRAVESHLTRARRLLRSLSLLAAAFAVTFGRTLRRALPASKSVAVTALLAPSIAVMLILGGSEPPLAASTLDPAPQPGWRPAQPPSGTGNPLLGTTTDQAPNGLSPLPAPDAAPPPVGAGMGTPGADATATDTPVPPPLAQIPSADLPALPAGPPAVQVPPLPADLPPVQVPPLPLDPPAVQVPPLPVEPPPLQVPPLPVEPPPLQVPSVDVPTLPIQPPLEAPVVGETPTLPLPGVPGP
jgi:DNA-directed RNA polymerase specialized sigma24 family protein